MLSTVWKNITGISYIYTKLLHSRANIRISAEFLRVLDFVGNIEGKKLFGAIVFGRTRYRMPGSLVFDGSSDSFLLPRDFAFVRVLCF